MMTSKYTLTTLFIFVLALTLVSCTSKNESVQTEASPTVAVTPVQSIEQAPPPVIVSQQAQELEETEAEEAISLSSDIITRLNPDNAFSLGLDRLVRSDYEVLKDRKVCVVTSRLAFDSDGHHILESLLPQRKTMVTRVVLFKDELPTPARSKKLDQLLALHPNVRIFERSATSLSIAPAMFDDTDVVLIDLPVRGGRFNPEAAFIGSVLTTASNRDLKVIIADRPLPISANLVDGPVGDAELHGSVSSYFPTFAIPGLTPAELARHYNRYFGVGANLEIIEMTNWQRFDGYGPLMKRYESLNINPGMELEEWSQYYHDDFRLGELNLVSQLIPADKINALEPSTEASPATLILNPAPLSAEDFISLMSRFETDTIKAETVQKTDGSFVALSSEQPIGPASLALSIWAIYSSADKSILPSPEQAGNWGFGNTTWAELLSNGRDPRELKRLWTQDPMFEELRLRRSRMIIYE